MSGDKQCWMVEGQNTMMILTQDTQRMIKLLRRKIEMKLQGLGYRELKEMEFEFKSERVMAFLSCFFKGNLDKMLRDLNKMLDNWKTKFRKN